ncbi:hypothetical protein [Halanaerobacter jeridensis]|uniref:Co-chaperonin GroES (HSP10) n=1 Tax=Halanaerobacter jeridensis TaxID=706427 RepID=A0A939BRS2_9FIRM|nr:hypothetical protein [Halanaerobacter jeridensis]MBM7556326.1 co-chaperonin GroES (HSP10) [Halanaerobacter jeridensis]
MTGKNEYQKTKLAKDEREINIDLEKRKTKIKINGNLIGPGIKETEEEDIDYKDQYDNKYRKEDGNLVMLYLDQNNELNWALIDDFKEGDYGLWLDKPAPYYLEQGKIFEQSAEEEDTKGAVLGVKENQYLKEEKRIKNNFLWIYRGDKIVFPEEKEENKKQQNKEQSKAQGQVAASVGSSSEKEKGKQGAATNRNSNNRASYSQTSKNNSGGNSQGSSSGGGQLYVCSGARLKCSAGSTPSQLQVVSGHNSKVCGNLIANVIALVVRKP